MWLHFFVFGFPFKYEIFFLGGAYISLLFAINLRFVFLDTQPALRSLCPQFRSCWLIFMSSCWGRSANQCQRTDGRNIWSRYVFIFTQHACVINCLRTLYFTEGLSHLFFWTEGSDFTMLTLIMSIDVKVSWLLCDVSCRFARSSTPRGRGSSSRKDTRRCRRSARRPYLK